MSSTLHLDAKFIGRLLAGFDTNGRSIAISLGIFGMLELVSKEIAIQNGFIHLPLNFYVSMHGKSQPMRLVVKYERLENSVIWVKVTRFGPLKSEGSIRLLLSTAFHFYRGAPIIIRDGPRLGLSLAKLNSVWPLGNPPEIIAITVNDQIEIEIK